MGIMCLKCNHVLSGTGGLHMVLKCNKCGIDDWSKFIRVDDPDMDIEKHLRDREWLEEHKADAS